MTQRPSPKERLKQIRAEAYKRLRADGFRFIEELADQFPMTLPAGAELRLFMPWLGSPPLFSIELHNDLIATVTPLKRGFCRVEFGDRSGLAFESELLDPFDRHERQIEIGNGQVSILTEVNCEWNAEAAVARVTISVLWEGPSPVVVRLLRGSVQ